MADETFEVVVDGERRYSIWPAHRPVPRGWRAAGVRGPRQACLDHIEAAWTDMRPESLRRHLAGTERSAP